MKGNDESFCHFGNYRIAWKQRKRKKLRNSVFKYDSATNYSLEHEI